MTGPLPQTRDPARPGSRDGAASPPAWRLVGALVLGALGISFSAIFVRLALPAPPIVTAFYRLAFALPLLVIFVGLRGARSPARPGGLARAALAGAFLGTDLALWHTAVVETSVANATLLVNTTPIPVGLWAAWVLRERPGWRFVAGSALALAGTALLLGVDRAGGDLRGDVLALVGALFYAGYLIGMKAVRRHVDTGRSILAATVGAVAVTGLYGIASGDPFTGFPARSWAAFAGAAAVSQVGGVLAIAWALRWLRTTFASVTLLVQPVGTALLGWLVLGEALGASQALGGLAVLVGIALASRSALDPDPDGPPPKPARRQSRNEGSLHQG